MSLTSTLALKLTCSHCKKILKNSIALPCMCESICKSHLDEMTDHHVKCTLCLKNLPLENVTFKSNKLVNDLIEKEVYMSDEAKELKHSLSKSFSLIHGLNEKFSDESQRGGLVLKVFNHFQDIKRKIDLQREELKEKIDQIALGMIDRTKEMEFNCMKSLSDTLK